MGLNSMAAISAHHLKYITIIWTPLLENCILSKLFKQLQLFGPPSWEIVTSKIFWDLPTSYTARKRAHLIHSSFWSTTYGLWHRTYGAPPPSRQIYGMTLFLQLWAGAYAKLMDYKDFMEFIQYEF